MTMASRHKLIADFCFANKISDLNKNYLLAIGKDVVSAQRLAFQDRITSRYEDVDKPRVMREIGKLDPLGQGSYERGCVKLLKWYRTKFWGWDMSHLSDNATSW